uniref:Uncharacterized protein n=1 Tax=Rhizophagus irregularis (strain DAOM 181602 / DAOM 197198 / MUCL 43194) TaxID=747089 RepID=U9TFF0_RHIID
MRYRIDGYFKCMLVIWSTGRKAMHDMLLCLSKKVHSEESKVRKLRVAGILHLGQYSNCKSSIYNFEILEF